MSINKKQRLFLFLRAQVGEEASKRNRRVLHFNPEAEPQDDQQKEEAQEGPLGKAKLSWSDGSTPLLCTTVAFFLTTSRMSVRPSLRLSLSLFRCRRALTLALTSSFSKPPVGFGCIDRFALARYAGTSSNRRGVSLTAPHRIRALPRQLRL